MVEVVVGGVVYRSYDHIYCVAKTGGVLRHLSPYCPVPRGDGYYNVGRQRLLHRMVAACWVENPNRSKHVHHKDKNKANNHADNLEWLTPKTHKSHHPEGGKYIRTDATREKLRQSRLGKKTSEETKQKQREASLRLGSRPPSSLGKKLSQEVKDMLLDLNKKPCEVDGIKYDSFKSAAESLGMNKGTVRRRLFSKNFPSYKVL